MPYKRPYRKKTYKKSYKKRGYKNALPFRYSPVPKRMFTKLKYTSFQNSVPSSGATAGNVMSANGAFDPDISGSGHQPRGFDQLMPLYDHYVVIGSKITVQFINTSSTVPLICFIALRDDVTFDVDINNYQELASVSTRPIGISTGSESTATMTFKSSPSKFLGRKSVLSDPDLKGDATSNPTEQMFYHVGGASVNQSDTGAFSFHYTIEYMICFIEPKNVAQS